MSLTGQQMGALLELHKKLKRETRQNEAVLFVPDPDNTLRLLFLIEPGLMEIGKEFQTPFTGEYLMEIDLGNQFPLGAPRFKLLTPNGRFSLKSTPCVAVYDIHGANYSPVAGVKGFVDYVVTAFVDDKYMQKINGSHIIHLSPDEIKKLAADSRKYNREHNKDMMALFDVERAKKSELQAKMKAKMEAAKDNSSTDKAEMSETASTN